MAALRPAFSLLAALAAVAGLASGAEQKQTPIDSLLDGYDCEQPAYKIHMVSSSPLVIYISDFVTPKERQHLVNITSDTFSRSSVAATSSGAEHNAVRTSQSTSVARDPIISCIEARALAFQGLLDTSAADRLEPLQLVRYTAGQRYHYHTDWFTDAATHARPAQGGNRISSFFAYIAASDDLTGGGTNFPLLEAPTDSRWCEGDEYGHSDDRKRRGVLDCDEEYESGITFQPIVGNAIFWENMMALSDGTKTGDGRVLHAGLPVTTGWKVGMNLWTRQGPLEDSVRGSQGEL